MKKIVTCFLTWLLVMQLFSLPGKAMQFQEKQIPVYDAFAEKFDEISLMFDDKEVYIKIDDLNQYTGYHFKDTENETCFTKGNRKVVIDDQKISDPAYILRPANFKDSYCILKKGKKVYHKITW